MSAAFDQIDMHPGNDVFAVAGGRISVGRGPAVTPCKLMGQDIHVVADIAAALRNDVMPSFGIRVPHRAQQLTLPRPARNAVNASGEVLFGLTDVKPGAMKVQGPGAELHNLMELSRIGHEELLPFAALLA